MTPLRLIALLPAIHAGRLGVQQSHVLLVTARRIPENKHAQPVFHIVTDSVIGSTLKSVAGGTGVCCIVRQSADNDGIHRVAAGDFIFSRTVNRNSGGMLCYAEF